MVGPAPLLFPEPAVVEDFLSQLHFLFFTNAIFPPEFNFYKILIKMVHFHDLKKCRPDLCSPVNIASQNGAINTSNFICYYPAHSPVEFDNFGSDCPVRNAAAPN
jgi:hypothetical protein